MVVQQVNGRADFYLKIIGVLVCTLLAVLSWVTIDAIKANATAHYEIKNMITSMVGANTERIKDMDKRVTQFFQNAPPPHVHLNNGQGGVRKVVP